MIEKIQASGLPALSAPFWFIEFFKVLGFILHMVPMNLWYAGVLLAVWLHYRGGEQGRRFGSRLMLQMPIIVAAGINLGIVPLLFLQVAYSRAFYPATILMAWFWLAIVVILIPAYYGVYAYSFGLRNSVLEMPAWQRYAGWLSAGLFVVIGFLFANGLSLTSRDPAAWRQIWLNHSVGGAATGTALNIGDVTFWPRWLLMFGLALITTAVWMIFDAFWIATRENEDYRRWVQFRHSVGLYWRDLGHGGGRDLHACDPRVVPSRPRPFPLGMDPADAPYRGLSVAALGSTPACVARGTRSDQGRGRRRRPGARARLERPHETGGAKPGTPKAI